jgi:hypothetical protein
LNPTAANWALNSHPGIVRHDEQNLVLFDPHRAEPGGRRRDVQTGRASVLDDQKTLELVVDVVEWPGLVLVSSP